MFGSNAVMQLGQRRFCPDVSVLLAASYGRIQEKRVIGPMDLAVEVISPSTRDLATGSWAFVVLPGLEIRVDGLWQDPLPSVQDCLRTS